MREKARDKRRIEDIISYSENVTLLVKNVTYDEFLVHDYANVSSQTLFDTATKDVPEIRRQAQKYLAEMDWESWC